MGVSAGMIWHLGLENPYVKKALVIFGIHLFINGAWSVLFFGLQMPTLAFFEIVILLASILLFSKMFHQLKPVAGWLQVPYILWVSFATVLNGSIAWLN